MPQENPLENKLGEFTQVDRSVPEKGIDSFDDSEVNKIIFDFEKEFPEVIEVLKSLSNEEKANLDKDLSFFGESFGLFNLLDESNQAQVAQLLRDFKEVDNEYRFLISVKNKEVALAKRKEIVKELIKIFN